MTLDSEKSLIVVGSPRSGTSLCMRAIGALGVPLKYVDVPEEKRTDKLRALNPDGYYEGPWSSRGLSTTRAGCAGHAIKVLAHAAMPSHTDYSLVSGVVLCARNPRDQMKSISEMNYPVRRMPGMWLQTFGRYASWLIRSNIPHVIIDFDDWYTIQGDTKVRSDVNARKLIDFLGSKESISGVLALFNAELVRNDKACCWEGAELTHGGCCDELYKALRVVGNSTGNYTPDEIDAATGLVETLHHTFEQKATDEAIKRKTRWVDVDSGMIADQAHAKLFHGTWNCTNAEDNMVLNANPASRLKIRAKHEVGVKYSQKNCEYFVVSNLMESKEIFNGDFPLTVLTPKVECGHCNKDVSMIDCYRCWHGGKRMGHEPRIGQLFGEVAL